MVQRRIHQDVLLAFAALALVLSLDAAEPPGYYATATGRTGDALREALHLIVSGHHALPYDSTRTDTTEALTVLDRDPANSNNVILIYSGYTSAATNFGNAGWEREHMWPNSYGLDNIPPSFTDLHNLSAIDGNVNSSRGNKFYDVADSTDPNYKASAFPEAPLCSSDTDSWEPRPEDRGRIARAIFYMAVRYTGDQINEPALKLTDHTTQIISANTYMGRLSTLLKWNSTYPVNAQEQLRNDLIYSLYQTNRNPFVDHPEWVNLAFAPALQVAVDGATLFIEWSADYRDAQLESSATLPATWTTVTNAPSRTNLIWRTTMPLPNGPRYYRLHVN
jgi:endonuclease I